MTKSVLLVDDSPSVRDALRKFLEEGCEVKVCGEAENGLDALEKVEELRPDLIVLDFAMPRMNGLEVADKLKCISPLVPILLLTAFGDRFLAELAYKAGVGAVISKGDLKTLRSCVNILLKYAPNSGN